MHHLYRNQDFLFHSSITQKKNAKIKTKKLIFKKELNTQSKYKNKTHKKILSYVTVIFFHIELKPKIYIVDEM